jgi:2-keto-4-pentenoate hydratase/2-oxohepta-3-ene-1,7-dioic acid hydratase in catechol pathway
MRIAVLDKGEGPAYFRLDDDSSATPFTAPPTAGGVPDERAPKVSYTPADLRAPVRPTKVLCVGRNYAAHAKELGNEVPKEPLLFLKPPTAVIGPEGTVRLPPESERVEHEVELAVVVGKRATRVSREEALAHVLGYTVACDVTARDLQRKDVQFTRAKGFDTFCPVGPWIETELHTGDLAISCTVSGSRRQDGRTRDMVFDVPTLVSAMSHAMTLEPGDLLLTGTPEGVGPLVDGDRLEVAIEGIGALTVRVEKLA